MTCISCHDTGLIRIIRESGFPAYDSCPAEGCGARARWKHNEDGRLVLTARPMISYQHRDCSGDGEQRFRQFASDPVPRWAVDVRPEPEDQ